MTIIFFFFFFVFLFIFVPSTVTGLGSPSTIAISYGSNTVCGIIAAEQNQRIECYRNNRKYSIEPNISYSSISGGRDFFCGLRSDGLSFLCWNSGTRRFASKRVYLNTKVGLKDLTVGDDHVCAIENVTSVSRCWWRGINVGNEFRFFSLNESFASITSGRGFSCGILMSNKTVRCWGIGSSSSSSSSSRGEFIQSQFGNVMMSSLVAGDSHACGLNVTGFLICKGSNDSRQLDGPVVGDVYGLALGVNHSCGILGEKKNVVCWGGRGEFGSNLVNDTSFESIVAGLNFTCGLTTRNLSLVCWGPGWSMNPGMDLPLAKIIPGPCTRALCGCGTYPDSETLCSRNGQICDRCGVSQSPPAILPPPPPPPPPPPMPLSPPGSSSKQKGRERGLLAFAIVGSVGSFFGLCTLVYCLWTGICCCNQKKVHNSVQPTINRNNSNATPRSGPFSPQFSRSSTVRRQGSRAMRRQRSGTSSKHTDRLEEFTLSELSSATAGFSLENKIGSGSFGNVYRGKLPDGREVAIKRGDTSLRNKTFEDKEAAFQSELAFLSRLHHKHLAGLIGYCAEKEERLLVYEYMKNGSLYDHLHSKNNVDKTSSFLNSWKMRIKISLDVARGIEYLHSYAVPPIIHRDIKSSNILLDANWTAKVSDFGLSLLNPEFEGEYTSTKAAGTVGYMDPEYYGLNHLTSKSDVYGLGVVLLELLTGKKAIFKIEEDEPTSVVEFAMLKSGEGELMNVLDARVGPPETKEAEGVELLANTAIHCVNQEAKERPSTTDIVSNLERAFALCDDSHGSISSLSIVSE